MKQRIGWFGMVLLVFLAGLVVQVLAAILVMLPVSFIVGFKAGMQGISDYNEIMEMSNAAMNSALGATVLVTHILLVITFAIWYRFGCGKPSLKKMNKKDILSGKGILVIVLVAAGMCFFTNFAMPIATLVVPESIMTAYEELMESAGFGESILPTIAAVLIAPFGEEFIFRGVTFFYAKKMVADMPNRRAAFWIANSVQALMFGVFHLNIVQGTYAFFMGLALGYLAHRFRSIIPSIAGHMIINGLSSFAWTPIAMNLPDSYVVYAMGAVISLALVIGGLYLGGPAEKKVLQS